MKNLVGYSSSDDDEEQPKKDEEQPKKDEEQPKKPVKLDKLPMLLKVTKKVQKDSPIDHEMRVRSVPHTVGNWATHVFIDCPLSEKIIETIRGLTKKHNDVHLVESPHISLSKTFMLKFHWIESFFKSLRERLSCDPSLSFHLQSSADIVYLANEEKTRHFACLSSQWSFQNLSALVEKVDLCLKEFNLPIYYEEPSFHISMLWKLKEFTPEEKHEISSRFQELKGNNEDLFSILVDKVSCKSGNKLMEVLL